MGLSKFTLTQAVWFLCACLLLVPRLAAGESSLTIDVDGDGLHDHVTLSRREPSVLKIWLSASGTTQVIYSSVPLLRVVVTDLDGDHRPELVSRDSESRIQVWTRHHRKFHSYRPRPVVPIALELPNRRRVHDPDTEPPGATPGAPFVPFALALCPLSRAPALAASHAGAPHPTAVSRSITRFDPLVPRPPPTHFTF